MALKTYPAIAAPISVKIIRPTRTENLGEKNEKDVKCVVFWKAKLFCCLFWIVTIVVHGKSYLWTENIVWITMVSMQLLSFQAPQQPKKAMKKITTPIPMTTSGTDEADAFCITGLLCIAIWTRIPSVIRAKPHNYRDNYRRKERFIQVIRMFYIVKIHCICLKLHSYQTKPCESNCVCMMNWSQLWNGKYFEHIWLWCSLITQTYNPSKT